MVQALCNSLRLSGKSEQWEDPFWEGLHKALPLACGAAALVCRRGGAAGLRGGCKQGLAVSLRCGGYHRCLRQCPWVSPVLTPIGTCFDVRVMA